MCSEPACPVRSFVEQDEQVAAPRAKLTVRACRWAIEQIRREHASVNGVRRQLGTGWRTVWESILPLLEAADQDASRFDGVAILGVDWGSPACGGARVASRVDQPVEAGGRGPKELTGMVDLARDANGHTRARLVDLVPGRSGETYRGWLRQRGQAFKAGVEIATLDPFHGYKNAIRRHQGPAVTGICRSATGPPQVAWEIIGGSRLSGAASALSTAAGLPFADVRHSAKAATLTPPTSAAVPSDRDLVVPSRSEIATTASGPRSRTCSLLV